MRCTWQDGGGRWPWKARSTADFGRVRQSNPWKHIFGVANWIKVITEGAITLKPDAAAVGKIRSREIKGESLGFNMAWLHTQTWESES